MDQLWLEIPVDFFSQVVYIHINNVGTCFKIQMPYFFDDVFVAEQFQKFLFLQVSFNCLVFWFLIMVFKALYCKS